MNKISSRIARILSKPREKNLQITTNTPPLLEKTLKKGDVLLVEGTSRISSVIKYLTQSPWSHSALYIGDALKQDSNSDDSESKMLIEADINEGIRAVPLSHYYRMHTRICRPVGLSEEKINSVIEFVTGRIGDQYDLKNIFDLARYLLPLPPVPARFRRRMLALGSGEPTRAICSSLIALAFQNVQYPILPELPESMKNDPACIRCRKEQLLIRHHSLFAPRDYDISPYFKIVKPTLDQGFSPDEITWSESVNS